MAELLIPGGHRIWYGRPRGKGAVRSMVGGWRRARQLNITVLADGDRHAKAVAIAFNAEGLAYYVEDVRQLQAIIEKLQSAHDMLLAHGQSAVVSLEERKDWNE